MFLKIIMIIFGVFLEVLLALKYRKASQNYDFSRQLAIVILMLVVALLIYFIS